MQVMKCVVALTQTVSSITVCATIHSPSPQTFALFDRLIILLRGRIDYFGANCARTALPGSTCMRVHISVLVVRTAAAIPHAKEWLKWSACLGAARLGLDGVFWEYGRHWFNLAMPCA